MEKVKEDVRIRGRTRKRKKEKVEETTDSIIQVILKSGSNEEK